MSAQKKELAERAAALVETAYIAGWIGGIKRMEGVVKTDKITPMTLLERFAALYGEVPLCVSMINSGLKLWRDYHEFMGAHMILTDEGWESGEQKQSYIDLAEKEGLPLTNFILDEVNAPARGGAP